MRFGGIYCGNYLKQVISSKDEIKKNIKIIRIAFQEAEDRLLVLFDNFS